MHERVHAGIRHVGVPGERTVVLLDGDQPERFIPLRCAIDAAGAPVLVYP